MNLFIYLFITLFNVVHQALLIKTNQPMLIIISTLLLRIFRSISAHENSLHYFFPIFQAVVLITQWKEGWRP